MENKEYFDIQQYEKTAWSSGQTDKRTTYVKP